MSLSCLPHSKIACTHDLHMHTHIIMPLSVGAIHFTHPWGLHCTHMCLPHTSTPMPTQVPAVPATRDHSLHTRSPHVYPHRHASAYRCLPTPYHAFPEPTPCTIHACLHPCPVLCPHRSLPCLPHSQIACTHDHHMSTYIGMPLPIGDFPCHARYAPLSLHHAHAHASLPPPPPCLHIRSMYLMSLPHLTTACTHFHASANRCLCTQCT